MPYTSEHRPKLGRRLPLPACVAKPVRRKIQLSNPLARVAMDAKWDLLRQLGTCDEGVVREWVDAAWEARQAGKDVQFVYLLGLCFEEGLNLPKVIPNVSSRAGLSSRATAS